MKSSILVLLFFIASVSLVLGQTKREREIRVDASVFPKNAKKVIAPYLTDAKHIKFYKEFDAEKISFEAKFKKNKLWYSIEFNKNGHLEDVEFIIKKADIPESTYKEITNYLSLNHKKYRIKKIQQQYLNQNSNADAVLKVAFQNLILPQINYEIIVASKEDEGYVAHEITFNANGAHVLSRKLVKPNYDHVLY